MTLHHVVQKPGNNSGQPAPALILLHGVRSNEQDLLGLAPMLDERFFVISARAPIQMGPDAYGWYHVQFTPTGFIADEKEAMESVRLVRNFVQEIPATYGIDPQRIFLMGFSQGCILSLGAALSDPRRYAGVVGMSGRLLPAMGTEFASEADLHGLPVMVVHGTQDSVIQIEYGREIRDRLSELPVQLTYREYPMAHHVSQQSLADIAAWLTAQLDRQTDWRTGSSQTTGA